MGLRDEGRRERNKIQKIRILSNKMNRNTTSPFKKETSFTDHEHISISKTDNVHIIVLAYIQDLEVNSHLFIAVPFETIGEVVFAWN